MKLKQIYNIFFVLVFLFDACFLLQSSNANQSFATTDSLLASGDSLLAQNKLDGARNAFKAALKIDNSLSRAMAGLGKIAVAEEKWADAGDEFGKILDRDPGNIEANYFKAICYRENGKFKAFVLRRLDWDKSNKHFIKVLEKDSLFEDVVYQLALLKRYQESYQEAILLGQVQIRLRSELVEPQVKLFRFYRYFVAHTKKAEAINWLKQQPWLPARWAIAEKLRREGELTRADSVLMDLLNQPITMSWQPVYLTLSRIYYEQNFKNRAEYYYWRAINEIQNDVDASLVFEDIKYILTDQELASYQSLGSIDQKIDFFRTIWVSRDPTPAAATNYRLAEHYRRLIHAEKHYEFDGFRTWFNNPDKLGYLEFTKTYDLNEEFNDKGLIYIRHGQYDDWAITVAQDIASNESWLYYETQYTPKMVFHFLLENTTGYWRFSPIITSPQMLEDRLQFGTIYYQLLRATPLERLAYEQEMAAESKEAVSKGLSTDRHTWEKKIKLLETPFSMSTFRGKMGKTSLEIYNAFSLSELADEKNAVVIEVEKGVTIHNLAWQEIEKYHEKVSLQPKKSESILDSYRFEVTPDSYHVAFYLRPSDTDFLGGWKYEIRVPDYSSHQLLISDIQLATRIEPASQPGKFEKNGLIVVPNPTRLFALNKPVYIYFEIYNLQQDLAERTSFIIEYTITLLQGKKKGLFGLFSAGDQSSITTQVERSGSGERSVEYLAIDVSQLKAGEYDLIVKVTDQLNGKIAVQQRNIALK